MTTDRVRLVAIVPAAGASRRMGQPKLLLPLGGRTVVARLIRAMDHPDVADVLVVIRPDDEALATEVRAHGGVVVRPDVAPADMKASVRLGVADMVWKYAADDVAGWLLIPADHPVVDGELVGRVIDHWQTTRSKVLVPTCGGRRGHPTLFSRQVADVLDMIPDDSGLNWLVAELDDEVEEIELGREELLLDLDTPEQYDAVRRRFEESGG